MKKMLLILPLLAACQTAPGTPVANGPAQMGGDACGASGYAGLVGQSLGATSLPADLNMRLINPGEMVTADFAPDRLNITVNRAGQIEAVSCG